MPVIEHPTSSWFRLTFPGFALGMLSAGVGDALAVGRSVTSFVVGPLLFYMFSFPLFRELRRVPLSSSIGLYWMTGLAAVTALLGISGLQIQGPAYVVSALSMEAAGLAVCWTLFVLARRKL